jgi:amidase
LGGLPVDPQVTGVIEAQRPVFENLGCRIDNCEPDFKDADEIFKVWRAWYFELVHSELLETHRDKIKDSVIWNIEEGLKLSGPQIGQVERKRAELYHHVRKFMETYAFLILPVSQVPPFNVKQRYIEEINGEKLETYIDWMKSCYYISTLGLPAISGPCGFTKDGLPVGVQIVGRHQDDLGVLQLAYAFEQATGFGKQKPPVVL